MRPARLQPVHRYCGVIAVLGLTAAALAALATPASLPWSDGRFWVLAVGVFAGELLPLKVPRRGGDEEITVSTTFSFALLLSFGLLPALAAQLLASVVQDAVARKPWWRAWFNVGQYALTLAAAAVVLGALSDVPRAAGLPFTTADVPAVLAAGAVFFFVNFLLVGVAISLHQRTSVLGYLRTDPGHSAMQGVVLLGLAPLVVAAGHVSPALLPLFALPLLAVYQAGRHAVRLEHEATHDPLTGLPNRARFAGLVEEALVRHREGGPASVAVLTVGLSRFRETTDALGNDYGELLLRRMGDRLAEGVAGADVAARLGSDEFALLAAAPGGEEEARALAARVLHELQAPAGPGELPLELNACVGIAVGPGHGQDAETLLGRSALAMHRARATHHRVELHRGGEGAPAPTRLALVADLRRALDAGELENWYQPKLDLRTGKVVGAEALVRWRHPSLGVLPPAAFVELAEHTGLMGPLTMQVLDEALRQRTEWLGRGMELAVAVNVSTRSLLDASFPEAVREALERMAAPAGALELEVTETSMMAEPAVAGAVLRRLQALGVRIAVDDFGTGYSSLAYLQDLAVGVLKIDKSFVLDMTHNTRDAAIVRSTIDLGRSLGLEVVAEGVETAEALAALTDLGCDLAQGYHLSPPAPPEAFERWLRGRMASGPGHELTLVSGPRPGGRGRFARGEGA